MHWLGAAPFAILWLAWLVYWIIAARNTKPLRRQESIGSRLTHGVPLAIGAFLLVPAGIFGGRLDGRFLPQSQAIYWAGVIMTAAGIAFMIWARRHLAGNWSGRVGLKQDHELICTGPYGLVRHPIYSGLLLALLGTVIAFGQWRGAVAFVFIAVALRRKSRLEERYLAESFSQDYACYRAQVPALIPSIFRQRPVRSESLQEGLSESSSERENNGGRKT
jgi:protein-S-isoprenylcysteine O-methyltransferase Ste14